MLFNVDFAQTDLNSGVMRTWWNYNQVESTTVFNPFYDTDWLLCTANVTSIEKLPAKTEWQVNNNIAIDTRNWRNSTSDIEESAGFFLSGGLLFNAINEDWDNHENDHGRFGDDLLGLNFDKYD